MTADNVTNEPTPWTAPTADLTGFRIAVIGGAGGVGEDVTRELLAAGASVVATGRNADRIRSFEDRVTANNLPGILSTERLEGLDLDLDAALARLASTYGPFDGAVLAVGTWGEQGQKKASDYTDAEWDAMIAGNLTSIFRLLRGFLPLMTERGSIVHINGLSAEVPYPGNSVVAASAAATKSIFRTLDVEQAGNGPKLFELILGVVQTRANPDNTLPGFPALNGKQAGQHIAALISGSSDLTADTLQYFVDGAVGPYAGDSRF